MSISVETIESVRVGGGRITASCAFGDKFLVGLESGQVRLIGPDGVLERSLSPSSHPIAGLTLFSNHLAVLTNGEALIYNTQTWKAPVKLSTSSAFSSATLNNALVVASKYKLRWLRNPQQPEKESVWDVPDGQRLRAMTTARDELVITLLNNGTIMVLDLLTERIRLRLQTGLPAPTRGTKSWSLTASDNYLLVAIGTKSQLWSLENMAHPKLIKQLDHYVVGAMLCSHFFVVANSERGLLLLNPQTGHTISDFGGTADATVLQPDNLAINATGTQLAKVSVTVTLQDVLELAQTDLREAISEAEVSGIVDPQIAELQQRFAAQLVEEGDIEAATQRLTAVELANLIPDSAIYGVQVVDPIIAGAEASARADAEALADDTDRSETASVFSAVSGHPRRNTKPPPHPLDPVVAYLLLAKRRLRLRGGENLEASAAVDTALFRSYMAMKSPLVAPLLRAKNSCDPEVVVAKLEEAAKWRELMWFLRSRGLHRQALTLMVEHAEPADRVAAYLEQLRGQDFELVTEFARQVIQTDNKYAEILFWDSFLDRSTEVLHYLKQLLPAPATRAFLEHRTELGDTSPELHEALALAYRDDRELDKLHHFLLASSSYRPNVLLDQLSDPQSRAILLGKLGDHKGAIDVFIQTSPADWDAAERYAVTSGHGLSYLFDQAIKSDPQITPGLLNRHPKAFDPTAVLGELPQNLSLKSIGPYLTNIGKRFGMDVNKTGLAESLRRVDLTEKSWRLVSAQKESWLVSSTTTCAWCQKRLGKSVLGIYHHKVMHYGCLETQLKSKNNSVESVDE